MDIIFLHGLKARCTVGVWEWERRIKQTLIFDVDLAADIRSAAATDELDDTLNYKAIARAIIAHVEASEYQLVETLAESVATLLIEEFKISWCRIKLNKGPAVRDVRSVGVIIERSATQVSN